MRTKTEWFDDNFLTWFFPRKTHIYSNIQDGNMPHSKENSFGYKLCLAK